jgi:chaperone required for assembly of F1-ATPase
VTQKPASHDDAKRFYDAAWAEPGEGGWRVVLDSRPVKTPSRASLVLPTQALAEAVAAEWEAQGPRIDPATMPMTRLANTAIDRAAPRRNEVVDQLLAYGETDLLCYRAEWPEKLTILQAQAWDPVLDWLRVEVGADLRVVAGVIPTPQSDEALAALDKAVRSLDEFTLTAMHEMTSLTVSLVLSLAVVRAHMSAEDAWRAAHVDEDWQIGQWGEDASARQRREAQWDDMTAAARFLALLNETKGP